MPGTQELQRRIKSVKSTRKITRAMQMVSAAKMRKSQNAASSSRGYTSLAMEMLSSLPEVKSKNPLLKIFPNAKKIGVIAISSNKGLVGSFNTNILARIHQIEKENPDMTVEVIGKGKKVCEACLRLNKHLVANFSKVDTTVGVSDIYDLARLVYEKYRTGEYRVVYIVYNHFYSTLVQKVTAIQLLPFSMKTSDEDAEEDAVFEPSPQVVLDHLLPRIVESQIYQALLESDASEHSSRMVMMKNATEAAGDIISDLTLTFNQLRQNKITTELSEITAGKIALENK